MEYGPTGNDSAMQDDFWINTPPGVDTPNSKTGTQSPTPEAISAVAYQALRIPSKGPFPEADISLEPFGGLSPTQPYPIPEFQAIHHAPTHFPVSNEAIYMPTAEIQAPEDTVEYQEKPMFTSTPSVEFIASTIMNRGVEALDQVMDEPVTFPNLSLDIPVQSEMPAPATYGGDGDWNMSSLEIPSQMEIESHSAGHTPVYLSDSAITPSQYDQGAANRVSTRVRRVCRSCAKDHKQCVGNPCTRCVQRGKECVFDLSKVPGPKPKSSPHEMH
jgi:hypothetical protein